MVTRKEIVKVIHGINLCLILLEEILVIDIDYTTFLLYLRMFKEFVQKQSDVQDKT